MGYVDGFVAAVPAANKDAYARHVAAVVPMFKDFGVARIVAAWGDAVPDGKVTDFKGAVKANGDEVVVFSWFEYADREARDAANRRMHEDPRMREVGAGDLFDARRMIFGGFATFVDCRGEGHTGYVDGFLIPVPAAGKAAYTTMAETAADLFREHGAIRVVEAWGDDVPDGKITDFRGAVKASGDEAVVYSWIEWPSKEVHDRGWEHVMADPRMAPDQATMPFDGQRMVFGGFTPLVLA